MYHYLLTPQELRHTEGCWETTMPLKFYIIVYSTKQPDWGSYIDSLLLSFNHFPRDFPNCSQVSFTQCASFKIGSFIIRATIPTTSYYDLKQILSHIALNNLDNFSVCFFEPPGSAENYFPSLLDTDSSNNPQKSKYLQ